MSSLTTSFFIEPNIKINDPSKKAIDGNGSIDSIVSTVSLAH